MGWKNWNGKQIAKETIDAASAGLLDGVEAIGAISDQLVPLDEGTLKNSKTIIKNPTNKLHVQIGYGGGGQSGYPRVPYAVKWHELTANFQKGRQRNYLRDPVRQHGAKKIRVGITKRLSKVW